MRDIVKNEGMTPGTTPTFCEQHKATMTGVLYVE
jgi:hypothetical protein